MSVKDWAKDDNGQVIVHPVLEYETAIGTSETVCLRIVRARAGERIANVPEIVQLALTPYQAALLAQDLILATEAIEAPKSNGPKSS